MPAYPSTTIRPLRRNEPDVLDTIVGRLSGQSRYLRFHTPVRRLTATMRRAMLDLDERRHIAMVAETDDGSPVGLAQMIGLRTTPGVAEIAVVVVDEWHRRGIGRRLVAAALDRAATWDVDRVSARVLAENVAARRLFTTTFPVHFAHGETDVVVLTGHLRPDAVTITMDDILADLVG